MTKRRRKSQQMILTAANASINLDWVFTHAIQVWWSLVTPQCWAVTPRSPWPTEHRCATRHFPAALGCGNQHPKSPQELTCVTEPHKMAADKWKVWWARSLPFGEDGRKSRSSSDQLRVNVWTHVISSGGNGSPGVSPISDRIQRQQWPSFSVHSLSASSRPSHPSPPLTHQCAFTQCWSNTSCGASLGRQHRTRRPSGINKTPVRMTLICALFLFATTGFRFLTITVTTSIR